MELCSAMAVVCGEEWGMDTILSYPWFVSEWKTPHLSMPLILAVLANISQLRELTFWLALASTKNEEAQRTPFCLVA